MQNHNSAYFYDPDLDLWTLYVEGVFTGVYRTRELESQPSAPSAPSEVLNHIAAASIARRQEPVNNDDLERFRRVLDSYYLSKHELQQEDPRPSNSLGLDFPWTTEKLRV